MLFVDFDPVAFLGCWALYLIWELGLHGGGVGKELEKTDGVAPGTDQGDNSVMGEIRRQEQYLPLGRTQRGSLSVAGAQMPATLIYSQK